MELYIFRHGQTVWNAAHKIQGSADIDLTDKGIEMAKKTAAGIKDIHFDAVYCSPLKRAYETACILKGNRDLTVIRDERIRELCFGDLEGQDFRHIQDEDFDQDHGVFFDKPHLYKRPNNGESLEELCQRCGDFIAELLKKHQDSDRILIVAHGAANKAMMRSIRKQEMKDFWYGSLQKNCGAVIVKLNKDQSFEILQESKVWVE